MKLRIGIILLLLCVSFMTACSQQTTDEKKETYIMDYALDAAGYCTYINKEIDACTNQITSLIMLADQVKDGEYLAEDCLRSAEYSRDIISSCYGKVDIMPPPAQYADTRENVLRCMDNAKKDIESLMDELSKSPVDSNKIESINSLLQGDYIALTAEFNVFYE